LSHGLPANIARQFNLFQPVNAQAFRAKTAALEDELDGMLGGQAVPVAIRHFHRHVCLCIPTLFALAAVWRPLRRAFFAKVAAWEDELVDMLEGQAVPVAIRNIVSVFKDRIHTERDKSEFKALCDKWTGVVEYPAGRCVRSCAVAAAFAAAAVVDLSGNSPMLSRDAFPVYMSTRNPHQLHAGSWVRGCGVTVGIQWREVSSRQELDAQALCAQYHHRLILIVQSAVAPLSCLCSGVKCLAIKSWMRGTHAPNHHHADNTDSDDVGDWDDDSS
jgi:hypothetical protein